MKPCSLIVLSLLACCGCDRTDCVPTTVRDETAFALIDGKPLTAADVKDAVLLQARIAELSGGRIPEESFTNWANTTGMRMVGRLINTRLLVLACEKEKIEPSEEDWKSVSDGFCRVVHLESMPREELIAKFGDCGDILRQTMRESALIAAYERMRFVHKVSEEMIDQYYVLKTNAMDLAKRTDDEARAKAEKAYARLKAGESWAKVAAECSEDKLALAANDIYRTDWVVVDAGAMGMPELARQLPTMKVGDYTTPFEHRDGMIIVHLESKGGGSNVQYGLSRMLFRMAAPVQMPKDRKTAEDAVRRQMLVSSRKYLLEKIRSETKIEYPLGEKFKYPIWKDKEAK